MGKSKVRFVLNLLFTGERTKETVSETVVYKSSQTHSGVCEPGGQAVMTGLVIQWLLIAAQQQSDKQCLLSFSFTALLNRLLHYSKCLFFSCVQITKKGTPR